MANTIGEIIYPGQGTGCSGWARRATVGKRDPIFFGLSRRRKKVTKLSNIDQKIGFIYRMRAKLFLN